ncbi:hypothetical protein KIH27_17155 [Mycobacterium sp. M1]|uniref:ABC transporter permease n=1 Tax=Mycolicibacter acidiphilus TaxID=2835306 RepID=A0ABS5RM58_9MYCO|nr:hypothetical protein [Mycolicibacter acidiphilus]MBS9535316.1 hypothetical protein [Mycolicibacter acidiphilus]
MLSRFLAIARRVLEFELPLGWWAVPAFALALPYLLIGVGWTAVHPGHLRGLAGIDLVVSVVGSVALWPVLVLAAVCLP